MANTFDDIITCSYKEYHQIILNYITYRITHRCEAEDLAQDVFVTNETEEKIIADDLCKTEQRILAAFPVQRRTVYALSRYEEKDTEEIANMLNLSQRTVDYHLFLGRRDMRRYMKNCI